MPELHPSPFYTVYNLADRRQHQSTRELAYHQKAALVEIKKWYKSKSAPPHGGILVLPTGGGKTYTAVYFLCSNPLFEGYKVLWLAHTHHLLEQASSYFQDLAGLITGSKETLTVRVVSGTREHLEIHTITPSDDVVVCSLQTAANAVKRSLPELDAFLTGAASNLIVIFDEAHHAPAPSYRSLLEHLRSRCPGLFLLGLTATPIYNDERRQGWLLKLFPQNILYQVSPQDLMAAGILSRPVLEDAPTKYQPTFDERAFQTWTTTYRDLPEEIIDRLATNKDRNDAIVSRYVSNREKYGKTIIFADRWYQCDYLREALINRKVRADVVYAHIQADPGNADARNRCTENDNAKALLEFKEGRLDVLINVRMLTEGTDVPDVQSVFLTRQTTSRNLLTQMVGRALRGKRFGGTEKAYIVSFIDDWTDRINFAAYDPLNPGEADDSAPDYGKRPPIQLVSIELVRRLSAQLDSGNNTNCAPYTTFLPAGWYLAEYTATRLDEEQVEPMRRLVMVFDNEKEQYERVIAAMLAGKLESFQDDTVQVDDARQACVSAWKDEFFPDEIEHIGSNLEADLFGLARHIAQNRQAPRFFPFEERDEHDLDALAQTYVSERLDDFAKRDRLLVEFERSDRYWKVFYNHFQYFMSALSGCVNRLLLGPRPGEGPPSDRKGIINPPVRGDREPSEAIKAEVKKRDHFRCVCCGSTRKLRIDHISARYFGGGHDVDNLQTLCERCNTAKGINEISFRINQTRLTSNPTALTPLQAPQGAAKDLAEWEMFLRRSINFFFRCAAVNHVEIGQQGEKARWTVWLFSGNNARWLEPHKADLLRSIREARDRAGCESAPAEIIFH
jgi:superfamily II DNA or RNA helicase